MPEMSGGYTEPIQRKQKIGFTKDEWIYPHILEGKLDAAAELLVEGRFEKNIKICYIGKNLYNGNWNRYYLKKDTEKTFGKVKGDFRTTDWFSVDPSKGYLNMTGDAFNRAVWQFRDKNGRLLPANLPDKTEKYRIINQKQFDRSCAKTAIPKNAAEARVYFAKEGETDSAPLGNRLQISYGLIPEYCRDYYRKQLSIEAEEKEAALVLGEKTWKVLDQEGKLLVEGVCDICWSQVEAIQISGIKNGEISLKVCEAQDEKTEKEYGIRWKMDCSVPLAERIGDCTDFHFNYMIGNQWAGCYPNDFDSIYPWSEIRICDVKVEDDGSKTILYEGENGFSRDGSSGEVMVEIPKFYAKREQKDGYEYLWITGKPRKGYDLDPSFKGENGTLEHVYVSAYPGSEKDGAIHSSSGTYVTLRRSMEEWQKMIDSVHGFGAYDLLMHLTVQKLFLVETAVLDSQAIFEGVVYLPYKVVNTETAYYALETRMGANEIIVRDTPVTRRLLVGDSASVLVYWRDYQNTPKYQRRILAIDDRGNGTLAIRFDGEPIDIYQKKTAISALPRKNGDCDSLSYHTARGIQNQRFCRGHESFRYRWIENLWGCAWMTLGNCYVMNNRLYIDFPDKTSRTISYELPVQNVILTSKQFGEPTEMCVKKMGYDAENPLIMMPSVIGRGASTNTYYCDAWYNIGEKDVKYLLTYGGAWDNLGYAGIFCYRANYLMKDKIPFNSVRLMLR